MKWSEEKKALRRQMMYRQRDVARLDATIAELRAEQRKFREHAATRFKWWIELMGEGKGPSLKWLIENDAKFLQTVEYFSW